VGQYIYKNSIKDNPYQKWIDTYSGEEFQNIVESAIALTNRAAEEANKDQLSLMKEAFLTSTRLELAFWDSAYKMESWKN
jgi:thiaminase/transcriptional activator TenA